MEFCQKVLENLLMENTPKRCYKIRQWVQGKKWERLSKKVLRNSSMGTGQKMGASFQKGVKKFVNRISLTYSSSLTVFAIIMTIFKVIYVNIEMVERCLKITKDVKKFLKNKFKRVKLIFKYFFQKNKNHSRYKNL